MTETVDIWYGNNRSLYHSDDEPGFKQEEDYKFCKIDGLEPGNYRVIIKGGRVTNIIPLDEAD